MVFNSVQEAAALSERYHGIDGAALLRALIQDEFSGRIALVSSFGAESGVLLDMVARIDPNLPVIFIDTKKLFPQTLAYRDDLVQRLGLKDVRTIYPDYSDLTRFDPDGTLFDKDANACCYIRKVKPLQRALKGFDAWITGRKRFQGGLRKDLPLIEAAEGRIKVNPLALWSAADIQKAFDASKLPPHPLEALGYLSIGCEPCTSLPTSQQDARSGRWRGTDKEECGIHLGPDGRFHRASKQ